MNAVLLEKTYPPNKTFQIAQGDITAENVDAIVNAANRRLQHGGGVAWTISRRGGRIIQRESKQWVREHGEVSHANPAWTSAGKLPCRYIIHAVGPVWGEGDEDAKLTAAIRGSLRVASELGLASISLPAISTGIFGFPKERAAHIIFSTIESYLIKNADVSLRLARLILYGQTDAELYLKFWRAYQQTS